MSALQTFTPMAHQVRGVEIARDRLRYGWWWKPGVGKTIGMLLIQQAMPMATLVVAPKTLVWAAWATDAAKVGMKVIVYHGTPKAREQIRREICLGGFNDQTIIATNFETLKIDLAFFKALKLGRLIVDETSMVRNRDTKNFNAVLAIADQVRSYYGLSGEPAPNGPEGYWSQLRLISSRPDGPAGYPGNRMPPDFWKWVAWWLIVDRKPIPVKTRLPGGGFRTVRKDVITGFRINPHREVQFRAMLAEWAQVLYTEDVLDLPPERDIRWLVELESPERSLYLSIAKDLAFTDSEGERQSIDSKAKHMKLRQVSGGNLRHPDGEWKAIGNSKIDALLELVETLTGEPVIVWTQFHAEADAVASALMKAGRSPTICDGRQSSNADHIAGFVRGDFDCIVAHPRSIGHGTTLHTCGARPCRYDIFYSLDYDWDYHGQARKRIHRAGQTSPVFHYYLLAKDTADAAVLDALHEKRDESGVVLAAVRALKSILSKV